MKVTAQCIPCYLNQCLKAMEKGKTPASDIEEILISMMSVIVGLDRTCTPAENSSNVLHELVRQMGGNDPFAEAKKKSNRLALELLPKLIEKANKAQDPLKMAIMFASAGNVVDLGLFADYDLEAAVNDVIATGFKKDDYDQLKEMLTTSATVLIIGDNSGEIVFDRILAQFMLASGCREVVYGVKGSFILNDATIEDAVESGIADICRVVHNGNNFLGTIEEKCSPEFLSEMKEADLIISKGQANYESLEGSELAGKKTFFLLKAKCNVVAENLGVNYGDMVISQNIIGRHQ